MFGTGLYLFAAVRTGKAVVFAIDIPHTDCHLHPPMFRQQPLITVTDTGTGIPEDKQELVFQRFEKLNEFVQGTGLGLAICKLTIQYMGGDIWIDKNYKNGARFIFSHPIKKQESTEK